MTKLFKDSAEENEINLNSLPLDCLIIIYAYSIYKDLTNVAISNSMQFSCVCFYLNKRCKDINFCNEDLGYIVDPYNKNFDKKHMVRKLTFIKLLKKSKNIKIKQDNIEKKYNVDNLIKYMEDQLAKRNKLMERNREFVIKLCIILMICLLPILIPLVILSTLITSPFIFIFLLFLVSIMCYKYIFHRSHYNGI